MNEEGGPKSRTGGISVSLSGPDGYLIGGGVGTLIAASLVQVSNFLSLVLTEPLTQSPKLKP